MQRPSILVRRLQQIAGEVRDEENSDKDVGCIAMMDVKCKCDLSKVINKRVQNTHQKRVLLKRILDEVKQNPIKDRKQAFVFGEKRWFTKEGFEVNHNGEIVPNN